MIYFKLYLVESVSKQLLEFLRFITWVGTMGGGEMMNMGRREAMESRVEA